jgi:hypothetical protein
MRIVCKCFGCFREVIVRNSPFENDNNIIGVLPNQSSINIEHTIYNENWFKIEDENAYIIMWVRTQDGILDYALDRGMLKLFEHKTVYNNEYVYVTKDDIMEVDSNQQNDTELPEISVILDMPPPYSDHVEYITKQIENIKVDPKIYTNIYPDLNSLTDPKVIPKIIPKVEPKVSPKVVSQVVSQMEPAKPKRKAPAKPRAKVVKPVVKEVVENTVEEENEDVIYIEPVKTRAKYRKEKIPATVRNIVWVTHFKESKKGQCWLCKVEDISSANFECGHVISEKFGGKATIDNLKPICSFCNKSVGTMNMHDFKAKYNIS